MSEPSKKKPRIQKLRSKYRLVILNDDTFEEKISLKLSRLNVFLITASSMILLVATTTIMISFTSLREYIPGYASTDLRRQAIELSLKTDSLEQTVRAQETYLTNLRRILSGDTLPEEPLSDTIADVSGVQLEPEISPADSALRTFVDEEEQFSIPGSHTGIDHFTFFAPVKGLISNGFDAQGGHAGIDVVAPKNTPVKSCLDGTVLFSSWTVETGHVIVIQHTENLISVYKHNSALFKNIGDRVSSGEAIAIIGNSGENSTGPHLHFELWHNGIAVNPQNYISF